MKKTSSRRRIINAVHAACEEYRTWGRAANVRLPDDVVQTLKKMQRRRADICNYCCDDDAETLAELLGDFA